MDEKELLTFLERRFGDLSNQIAESRHENQQRFGQIDDRFGQIDARLDRIDARVEQVETEVRHAHVQIESLRGDIRLVAEGVLGVSDRLESHRLETAREFEETRALLRLSYAQIEQRVKRLETRTVEFDARLMALESARQ